MKRVVVIISIALIAILPSFGFVCYEQHKELKKSQIVNSDLESRVEDLESKVDDLEEQLKDNKDSELGDKIIKLHRRVEDIEDKLGM